MSWGRVDDKLHSHPKVDKAGVEAMGLWAIALSYCQDAGTGGLVTMARVIKICGSAAKARKYAQRLVDAGLWEVADGQSDTFAFHDFGGWNPDAEALRSRREEISAKRQEAGRRGAVARWQPDAVAIVADGKTDGNCHGKSLAKNSPARACALGLGDLGSDLERSPASTALSRPPQPEVGIQPQRIVEDVPPASAEPASGSLPTEPVVIVTPPLDRHAPPKEFGKGPIAEGTARHERGYWEAAYARGVNRALGELGAKTKWVFQPKGWPALRSMVEQLCEGEDRAGDRDAWVERQAYAFVRGLAAMAYDPKYDPAYYGEHSPDGFMRWHNDGRRGEPRPPAPKPIASPRPPPEPPAPIADQVAAMASARAMLLGKGLTRAR